MWQNYGFDLWLSLHRFSGHTVSLTNLNTQQPHPPAMAEQDKNQQKKPASIIALEKEIGQELTQHDKVFSLHGDGGYEVTVYTFALNHKGEVSELTLDQVKLTDYTALTHLSGSLTHLGIIGSQVNSIRFIKGFHSLQVLALPNNQINDLSPLTQLKQLRHLYLSGNPIQDITPIAALKDLGTLYIGNTNIQDITPITALEDLVHLSIRNTNIQDYSPLLALKKLKILYLGATPGVDFSFLQSLTGLKHLSLGSCKLSSIGFIRPFTFLESLYLSDNQITDLTPLIPLLEKGLDIYTDDRKYDGIYAAKNPLEHPPMEVVAQGREAVLAYFSDYAKGKGTLNEVKVLLVGDGEAGKTSLSKVLRGQAFNAKESQTHGINIEQWKVNLAGAPITAHIWDFGGQEIMHATHQFFLSKRSLYLLVLDGRREERPEYWLKHIKAFGGESPVIVVMNKSDENRAYDIDRHELSDKFPNILGFYRTSCQENTGLNELKAAVKKQLATMDICKKPFPASWRQVKDGLVNMKGIDQNYLSHDEYTAICVEAGVTSPVTQKILAAILDDLGVALRYEHDDGTLVFNPEWLTQAVYRVINAPKVAEADGMVLHKVLPSILMKRKKAEYKYPKEKYPFIMGLMEQFELCYLYGENQWLVPDLLPKTTPLFLWEKTAHIRIKYKFLPKSIFPRLMVQRHQEVKQNLHWRTGMVLEAPDKTAEARIKVDYEESLIEIEVQGDNHKTYLSSIRETLASIHKEFSELGQVELVPIPITQADKVPQAYHYKPYEELIGLMRMNEALVLGEYDIKLDPREVLVKVESARVTTSRIVDGWSDRKATDQPQTQQKTLTPKQVRDTVFICYSRANNNQHDVVKKQLKGLEMQGIRLSGWSDQSIAAGDRWNKAIQDAIDRSKIAVLLVSNDFLASEFIMKEELPRFLALDKAGELTIIPVFLERCVVVDDLDAIQGINDPKTPMNRMSATQQEDLLYELADRIKNIIKPKKSP